MIISIQLTHTVKQPDKTIFTVGIVTILESCLQNIIVITLNNYEGVMTKRREKVCSTQGEKRLQHTQGNERFAAHACKE